MKDRLEDWIDGRHLSEDAQAAAAGRFADDPYETVWFDDFLRPDRLEALRAIFERDGRFEPWLGLYGLEDRARLRFVDAAEFAAAPPSLRFEEETILVGPRPDRPLAPGWLLHAQFLQFCHRPPFVEFLRRVTGIDPVGVNSHQVRITHPGHYVGRHTDASGGRRMCLVLYCGREWDASDAGRFIQFHPDGRTRTLEPRPGRLVLFRTSRHSDHEVERVADGAHPRFAYTIWMGDAS